jgi:hypothetical protein
LRLGDDHFPAINLVAWLQKRTLRTAFRQTMADQMIQRGAGLPENIAKK